MWLPRDERRLLQGYYVTIGEVSKQHEFSLDDLLGFIKSNASSELPPSGHPQRVKKYEEWLKDRNRVIIANEALEERGLITGSRAFQVFVAGIPCEKSESNQPLAISLTINGYDLGRKYNSPWVCIKLWYEQYIKNHPIILLIVSLISYIAGIISMLLVNWLSK
jgi:hypothetical protein